MLMHSHELPVIGSFLRLVIIRRVTLGRPVLIIGLVGPIHIWRLKRLILLEVPDEQIDVGCDAKDRGDKRAESQGNNVAHAYIIIPLLHCLFRLCKSHVKARIFFDETVALGEIKYVQFLLSLLNKSS